MCQYCNPQRLMTVTALSIIIVFDHAINTRRIRNSYITRANNLSNISPKDFFSVSLKAIGDREP